MITKRRRIATIVGIFVCIIFNSIRVDASSEFPNESKSIVIQMGHKETQRYVYRNGKVEKVGETEKEIIPYYITRREETVESIAERLQVLPEDLMVGNENVQLLEDGTLPVQTYLKIPKLDWSKVQGKIYYYVDKGDCISVISEYFGIGVAEIIQCNNEEKEIVVSNEGSWYSDDVTKNPCIDEDILAMFMMKKKLYLMDNPESSIWRICPEITNSDLIYAGDFIRIK